jgi:hypothetical protein
LVAFRSASALDTDGTTIVAEPLIEMRMAAVLPVLGLANARQI